MKYSVSPEKLYNIVLGLNVFAWGIAGLFYSSDTELTPVRICISSINIIAGLLFISRRKIIRASGLVDKPSWFFVLFCNGLLFKLSLPLDNWSLACQMLFVGGTIFTLAAFLNLGKNFSIRPAYRGLVTNGFYRLVRHPIYMGETIMALACLLSGRLDYALPVFAFLMFFQILRIREEEGLLKSDEKYADYVLKTRWRLIPFVW